MGCNFNIKILDLEISKISTNAITRKNNSHLHMTERLGTYDLTDFCVCIFCHDCRRSLASSTLSKYSSIWGCDPAAAAAALLAEEDPPVLLVFVFRLILPPELGGALLLAALADAGGGFA